MTSEEATAWIHSRLTFGQRPGLMRVEALLKRMGNPEKKVTMIHIAGTNGKGSTTHCAIFPSPAKSAAFIGV